MASSWKRLFDGLVLAAAAILALISFNHIRTMWSMRRDFAFAVRSPKLGCMSGLLATVMVWNSLSRTLLMFTSSQRGPITLLNVILITTLFQGSYVIRSVRLLILFDPVKRRRWNHFLKENIVLCALLWPTVMSAVAAFSATPVYGMQSGQHGVADTVVQYVTPVQSAAFVSVAVVLFPMLRKVDDVFHMSRELLLVGGWTLLGTVFFVGGLALEAFVQHDFPVQCCFVLAIVSSLMLPVYLTIQPARECLRDGVAGRRSIGLLPFLPWKMVGGASVAVTSDRSSTFPIQKRASVISTRSRALSLSSINDRCKSGSVELADVINCPPLRDAFEDFCRKAFCSESLHFLIAVSEYNDAMAASEEDGEAGDGHQFEVFAAIVDEYIRRLSPSEVNIESKTTTCILNNANREKFLQLDLEVRRNLLAPAAKEIRKMLTENVLIRFKACEQYCQVAEMFLSME